MCTALTYHNKGHYFGRNLDLEYSYCETVSVTPRNYPFRFRRAAALETHHAMIGMAYVREGYPLYYDAVNEHGLAMAGLNFPGSAVYREAAAGKDNITPFEFIPWVLGQCADLREARALLARLNLLGEPFSAELPLSPLHWILADKESAITVEAVAEGLKIYENPVGVLTNNPPFDFMQHYLSLFRDLAPSPSENRFAPGLTLPVYCQGLATVGLPGDWSSPSRFVRAAFVKQNSAAPESENGSVSQFFHMLGAVEMPRGSVFLREGVYDITVYSACCDQDSGVYYYTTYDNKQISAVDMYRENLDGTAVISYPLRTETDIHRHN